MPAEQELRELMNYTSPDPVLSVYLNTEPSEGNRDAYRLRLRKMLKEVSLPEDVETIENYFQRDYDWTGRGVALFSCAPQKFFRVYPLAISVPDLVHVGDRPSVRVMADLLDSYGGYGVLLVDKQGARAYLFHLGELKEQEDVMGEEVRRTKKGAASSIIGVLGGVGGRSRHMEEVIDRNMKDSVDFAVDFLENNNVRRILIGGTEDNVALFRGLLPKAWQSLVVGTFSMRKAAGHLEVMNKAMQVGREAEKRREKNLIENLVTLSAKAAGAVSGLDDTLEAINSERIRTLVLLNGYKQPAYQCPKCNYLTVKPIRTCVRCGNAVREISDVIDSAINRTMSQGGDVEVIHANPELEKVGKIGAFLRY